MEQSKLTREQFANNWRRSAESQEAHVIETAWRRYQFVQDASYVTEPEHDDFNPAAFDNGFKSFLGDPTVRAAIADYNFDVLLANTIPWTATDLIVHKGQTVSTFAAGRVWRSRQLDLWLRPQFALWYKVGVNGTVFNSTGHSNTFKAESSGELYIANQFPGQFGEPRGGRLATPLNVYSKAEGMFQTLVISWKDNANALDIMKAFQAKHKESLIGKELDRAILESQSASLDKWTYLWFLGKSTIYTIKQRDGERCMHCKPYGNVGILQKDLEPPLSFTPGTQVSWDWLITSLPSRLREDTSFSHDYLSIAFEFENGRDLTYMWSWELPEEFGFWCPLPAWADREYHVVIRSGPAELGQWKSESRDLHADYVKYIENGKEVSGKLPRRIVRVWFIAGNRWQRFDGEMSVERLRIRSNDKDIEVM